MMWPVAALSAQTINELVCINAKVLDPVTPLKRFNYVRVYQDESGPFLRDEDYYRSLNGRCIPVLRNTTLHFRGRISCLKDTSGMGQQVASSITPAPQTAATFLANLPAFNAQNLPTTWESHALWVSDFAAKFGVSSLDAGFLGQSMGADQGLPIINPPFIEYLEDNMETNKNWLDEPLLGIKATVPNGTAISQEFQDGNTAIYVSPSQYGAMFRADVHGNNGNMTYNGGHPLGIVHNSNIGVGNIAMAGTTGLNGAYTNQVSTAFGSSNFIANFHHYSTDKTAEQSASAFIDGEFKNHHLILLGAHGVCPEVDELRQKLISLKAGLSGSHPEIWLSEFGYDSWGGSGYSSTNADPITGPDGYYDAQKVQAQWLTRGILETAASEAIDKLMLYELRDDQVLGGTYRFSGLTDFSGNNKRAWYYIMTLKKILGEYTFEKILENGVDYTITTDAGPNTKVRVYQFTKGNPNDITNKMFVVWSATMEAHAKFKCSITFPSSVPVGTGTLYRIQELSEVGTAEVLNDVVGQTVVVQNVSETPLFFKLDAGVIRTSPGHVSNLTCSANCCGSVTLNWKNPELTRNQLIYYCELQPGETTCPSFDPVTYRLFANTIGSLRSSYTVSGLKDGKDYCFAVIPVNLFGLVPIELKEAPTTDCSTNAASCADCFIQITQKEVYFSPGYSNDTGSLTTITDQAHHVLGITGPDVTCATLTQTCEPNQVNWNEWLTPSTSFPDPNTIYIKFDQPKILNTIFFQDWNGNGQVMVEYKKCNCPNVWYKLSKVDFIGDFYCGDDGNPETPIPSAPLRILGNIPPIQITELRITRLHPQLHVGHIVFCGKDTDCKIPQSPDGLLTPEISADEIRENSALLNWTAIPVEKNDEFIEMAAQYELKISQFRNTSGELLPPITTIPIEADILDYDHYYRLNGLAPGTTYYTEVNPIIVKDCEATPAEPTGHKAQFTTLSDKKDPKDRSTNKQATELGANKQSFAFSVSLRPNPATDIAQIVVSDGAIGSVSILDNLGRIVKNYAGNQTRQMEIKLDGVSKGNYWLRVQNTTGSITTVAFAKM